MNRRLGTGARRVLLVGVLVGSALVAVPSFARTPLGCDPVWHGRGGDWPMQGGDLAQTNVQSKERAISATNVGALTLRWASAAPVNPGIATPVVSGSCLYVIGSGVVQALDATSGKLVWRAKVPLPAAGGLAGSGDPFGLMVDRGQVFADAGGDGKPNAWAFDARTGALRWISAPVYFGYEAAQAATPKVLDGIHILFTTGPDFDPHARPGYALIDAKTGKVLFKRTTIPPALLAQGYSGGGVWASAALDPVGKYAFVGTSNPYSKTKESPYDNAIIKIDMDKRRRSFGQIVGIYKGTMDTLDSRIYTLPPCSVVGPTLPADGRTQLLCGQQDADFAAGPTLFTDRYGRHLLVELQKTGELHLIDRDTMTQVWRLPLGLNHNLENTGGNGSAVAYDGKRIYVVTNPGTLQAIDPESGAMLWTVPGQENAIPFRPTVAANGVVWTVTHDGSVVAHDAATGTPLALFNPTVDSGRNCNPGVTGGFALAHNMVYLNCTTHIVAYGLTQG